LLAPVPQNLF